MRYQFKDKGLPDVLLRINDDQITYDVNRSAPASRTIIKNGRVIDPYNQLDAQMDIALINSTIENVSAEINPAPGDRVIDARGLIIMPGIMDMHLHVYDIPVFQVKVMEEAAVHGITTALTAGAANTIRATSFFASEVDRGSLINLGCFVGAPALLAADVPEEELVNFLLGRMDEDEAMQKLVRSRIAARTAPYLIGIKDHHSHLVLSPRQMQKVARLAADSKLLFMSHTQCPEYAGEIVEHSKGHHVHFGHCDASACGSHGDGRQAFKIVLDLIAKNNNVTGEFTSTLLRPSGGDRDGIRIPDECREMAFQALRDGVVEIIVSDGPSHASKGFGDTKDSVPLLCELIEQKILSPLDAVATMTLNPARLMSRATRSGWWEKELGSLAPGSRADLICVNPLEKEVAYTFVYGEMVAFEGRVVTTGYGSGGWVTRLGIFQRTGLGDLSRLAIKK
ncbi:MAG: amidohydrolase family protein [Bacillota bacterium]